MLLPLEKSMVVMAKSELESIIGTAKNLLYDIEEHPSTLQDFKVDFMLEQIERKAQITGIFLGVRENPNKIKQA
jgi:hypothetical protein